MLLVLRGESKSDLTFYEKNVAVDAIESCAEHMATAMKIDPAEKFDPPQSRSGQPTPQGGERVHIEISNWGRVMSFLSRIFAVFLGKISPTLKFCYSAISISLFN